MIKISFLFFLISFLNSCGSVNNIEEHKIANTLNKEALNYFQKDTTFLFYKGTTLRDRNTLNYMFHYKQLYNHYIANEEIKFRVWFEENYKYCITDKDINYILDKYLEDNKEIKWKNKKLKNTFILKEIKIGKTLKDTAIFQINRNKHNQLWTKISKPYFSKNKKFAITIFSSSTLTMNGEEGLYILAKKEDEWIVVGKIFIGIN